MKKPLKFKQKWFEILNQCSLQLRADVIEAVFQYYFAGVEPHFEDDARKIAFGFIRAEIDVANARSRARIVKNEELPVEGVKPVEEKPIEAVEPIEEIPQKPTDEEAISMLRVRHQWNRAVASTEVDAVDMAMPADAPDLIPLLRSIRLHGEEDIIELIRLTDPDEFVEFDEFFRKLSQ